VGSDQLSVVSYQPLAGAPIRAAGASLRTPVAVMASPTVAILTLASMVLSSMAFANTDGAAVPADVGDLEGDGDVIDLGGFQRACTGLP